MNLSLLSRYAFFAFCVLFTLGSLPFLDHEWLWPFTLLGAVLSLIGIGDLLQKRHAVRRNYPILGNIRYLVEGIRPEIRQYLLEGDAEQLPFSRSQRSLVYSRAKNEGADKPFGTLSDVYQSGFEFISHSMRPAPLTDPCSFRVEIGGPQCRQPYSASLFNISAMSFGSLSANAIRALNEGAKLGDFYHDTGEGSISPYHREHGGDLVWELGSGYFGCRTSDGRFDAEHFAAQASTPQVKMIEIKLSQGAKPGHGGMLLAAKVTAEIAAIRGVPQGKDCISPPFHTAFTTPDELLAFAAQLRQLCGGKPVGVKLCIGHPWEFIALVRAMADSGQVLDFITVDGAEGGTGAAPVEFTDHLGTPLQDALVFVDNCLTGAGLRPRVKVGASGRLVSAYDVARACALGADWVNMARPFMFALGCIQARDCASGNCPTGLATMDPDRYRVVDIDLKAQRVANFHHNTVHALAELLAASGVTHPGQLTRHHFMRRQSGSRVQGLDQVYPQVAPGALLSGGPVGDPRLAQYWPRVSGASFGLGPDPAQAVLA